MVQETDEEIALRVQGGDIEAFGVLIRRFEGKLTRYAKRFFFDGEETRDLIQDVFIKAYTNIQNFDAAKKLSPWIYRIAHNEFINAIRKKGRMPVFSFDADVFLPHLVSPETAACDFEKQELEKMLDQSLGKLKPKYSEPIILYYFEELSYEEISEVLKIPIGTIGVRLKRGKELLKKIVKKYE